MGDKKIRLLLVEDDKVDQMAFERFVRDEKLSYEYTIAGSISESEKLIAAKDFDIAIMDYMLGDGTLFDLFDLLKDIPVIVTTGAGNEEIAANAMKAGACDYLIKDPEGRYLRTLPFTVESVVKRKETEKELENYRECLELLVMERTAKLEEEIAGKQKAEEALRIKAQNLEEINTALNVLLKKRAQDKITLEENVVANINHLVSPSLAKLLKSRLNANQKAHVEIVLSSLKEVISEFSRKMSSKVYSLSPAEIQVVNFIKHGKNTKEIASALNISTKTVKNHRQKIREKVGIRNKKINLRTYLLSLN